MSGAPVAAGTALRRLGLVRRGPEAALVVPVPAASHVIARARPERPASVAGMPPHLTLLYPFVPPALIDGWVETSIAEVAARFRPFKFRLARIGRFPGVLYLEPDPVHSFVALIDAMQERWPQHRPYGGRYAAVVPHVTVLTGPEPPGIAASLQPALPVECEAEHVQLLIQDDGGRWRVRHQVSLGE